MARTKAIAPGEPVGLKLTATERAAILDHLQIVDDDYLDRIRETPKGKPIPYTLDEVEDFAAFVSRSIDDLDSAGLRKKFDSALSKMSRLLDTHTVQSDAEEKPNSFEEPLSEVSLLGALGGMITGDMLEGPPPPMQAPDFDLIVSRIRLSKAHRDTLLEMDTISGDIHKLISVNAKGDQTFSFNSRQTMVLGLALAEAHETATTTKQCRQFEKVLERMGEGMEEMPGEINLLEPMRSGSDERAMPTAAAFQLKITLDGSKPPIWRRVCVPDCTLDVLHDIIQIAMGWHNCHLHEFQVEEDRFVMDNMDDLGWGDNEDAYSESEVLLSQIVANGFKKIGYWYDFGDDWRHTILIEKVLKPNLENSRPVCIKGVRACPPDDIGGLWGYADFLEAMADPKHERHAELKEWYGGDFDPKHFDLEEVNRHFEP